MVMFSTYNISTYYQEKILDGEKIIAYAIDPSDDILIIAYKTQKLKAKGAVRFKFYCLVRDKTLLCLNVTNPDIVGRIKLGLFNLINGHMYFSNKVIKIRYDLLRAEQV